MGSMGNGEKIVNYKYMLVVCTGSPVPPGNRDSTDATNFAILAQTRDFEQNPRFHVFFVVSALYLTLLCTFHTVLSIIL